MIFTLVGMPGCGKSCMGRAIAGKLKMSQVDTDRLIERRYKKKLHQLVDELGSDGFRKIEEETLLSVYNNPGDTLLLSTGGSAVYSERAMEYLKSMGKIVYLYCSYETIVERLGDYTKRGIVMAPGQSLRDLYNERCKLYEKYADITIDCDGSAYSRYQAIAIKTLSSVLTYNE